MAQVNAKMYPVSFYTKFVHILCTYLNIHTFLSLYIVNWRKGVDSLESAHTYLKLYPCIPQHLDPVIYNDDIHIHRERQLTLPPLENESNPGRSFIDRHLRHIIMKLLEQQPMKIGDMEKECVLKSLMCAIHIIQEDLKSVNELESKG